MASKCKNFLIFVVHYSIITISMLQVYFKYSTFITPRNESLAFQADRNDTQYSYKIGSGKFEINSQKIKENFNISGLMNIEAIRNFAFERFDKLNENRERKIDKSIYMLYYFMISDIIYLLILYSFFFERCTSGIITIIIQIFKCYSNTKRIKKSSPDICVFEAVKNFFGESYIRNSKWASPEGYQIFEFLCNFVIILDIIYLIILIRRKCNKKNQDVQVIQYSPLNDEMNDDNRKDYQDEEDIDNEDNDKEGEGQLTNGNNNDENNNDNNNEDEEDENKNEIKIIQSKENNINEKNNYNDNYEDNNCNIDTNENVKNSFNQENENNILQMKDEGKGENENHEEEEENEQCEEDNLNE